jgi:FixJ family two-component response regulator
MSKDLPPGLICIVDDDAELRQSLDTLLRSAGHEVRCFAGPEEFLHFEAVDQIACLILDVWLGSANGLDLQEELLGKDAALPIVLVSGRSDIPTAVRGMRAGALTFLTKPFEQMDLLAAVDEALRLDAVRREQERAQSTLRARFDKLTAREREVFSLVTSGLMNKQVAGRLQISEITVKIHRGNMMRKMAADSLADLVRMADGLGLTRQGTRYAREQHIIER